MKKGEVRNPPRSCKARQSPPCFPAEPRVRPERLQLHKSPISAQLPPPGCSQGKSSLGRAKPLLIFQVPRARNPALVCLEEGKGIFHSRLLLRFIPLGCSCPPLSRSAGVAPWQPRRCFPSPVGIPGFPYLRNLCVSWRGAEGTVLSPHQAPTGAAFPWCLRLQECSPRTGLSQERRFYISSSFVPLSLRSGGATTSPSHFSTWSSHFQPCSPLPHTIYFR